ncbi:MAG: transcriptional regulator NrdR [bacterium]|nr:transcriptional regulator NrdR [bacterium]MDE0241670.1 transcriptional regulator NrdR [bacterium]MDE0416743.1 transcriptional regulator NrdR [bacterium]
MKCPACKSDTTQVKDSRPAEDGVAVRRRRECTLCGVRFTTYERLQLRVMMIIKKSGERVPFNRDKLAGSILVAMRKRPFSEDQLDHLVADIQRQLERLGEREVHSSVVGEMVLAALSSVDDVAFVRFASVYRNFDNARDFAKFIEGI